MMNGGAALNRNTQEFLTTTLATALQGYGESLATTPDRDTAADVRVCLLGATETCGMCCVLLPSYFQVSFSAHAGDTSIHVLIALSTASPIPSFTVLGSRMYRPVPRSQVGRLCRSGLLVDQQASTGRNLVAGRFSHQGLLQAS